MPDGTSLDQRIHDAPEDADIWMGNAAHLTTDELAEQPDIDRDRLHDRLQELRFVDDPEHQVAKGPDEQWQLVDEDAYR